MTIKAIWVGRSWKKYSRMKNGGCFNLVSTNIPCKNYWLFRASRPQAVAAVWRPDGGNMDSPWVPTFVPLGSLVWTEPFCLGSPPKPLMLSTCWRTPDSCKKHCTVWQSHPGYHGILVSIISFDDLPKKKRNKMISFVTLCSSGGLSHHNYHFLNYSN